MKKVQEMTREEFIAAFNAAETGDLVCENIRKQHSAEGFDFVANAGDCDGGDTILYFFEDEADEDMYVDVIDARI